MNRPVASARLRGWLSVCASVVSWLILPLYAASWYASYLLERGAGVRTGYTVEDLAIRVGFGAFAAVGALLVVKRPTNLIGWIMTTLALMIGLFPVGDAYAGYVMTTRGHPDALAVLGAWVQSWYWFLLIALTFVYLPLLFPDGRLPSRRWLPVAVLPGIAALAALVLGALTDTLTGQNIDYRIDNPIGIEGLAPIEELPIFGLLGVLLAVGILTAMASVLVRFRRSRGVEREQMKWFLYASALLPTFLVSDYLPDVVGAVLFSLVFIALPVAIGVAILRYRLYEIDLIISRTLVYGPLTAMLVLLYVGSVVSLQYAFRVLTGQSSQIAIVASTLAIAALFSPLRGRIQSFIDRSFYRRKYDAAKTLAQFSSRLRDETDLDSLNGELVSVVRETMQPANVSLWLRPDTLPTGGGSEEPGEPRQ
jgi:hypothetical protein